jgi:hypothetical protein
MSKHFVHNYKWSHDYRREKFKQLKKTGLVRIVKHTNSGILYQSIGCSIKVTRKGKIIVNTSSHADLSAVSTGRAGN